jgi:L-threonylcarbamoyladenylate synthase
LSVNHKIRRLDAVQPKREDIIQAAGIIKAGGVVVFPTACLYGLGANAMDPLAIERLYEIKQRPAGKPILLLIHDLMQLQQLVRNIPAVAEKLINHFWPGQVTLVFHALRSLPQGLTAGSGKIGVRMASHPAAIRLLQAVGWPMTGTSANLSGQPGCADIADLDPAVSAAVDLILDAGRLEGGPGSTVVDVTVSPPVILREGAVAAGRIRSVVQERSKGIDK